MKKKCVCLLDSLSAFVLLLSVILIFSGCKKNGPAERAAGGSLENEKGNCLPATVKGNWYSGVEPSADSNYVDIGVNVTRVGHYRIVSDMQNGVEFADSGVFSETGLQVIHLKSIGVFADATSTFFTIAFDNSVCGFSVNVGELPLADNSWRFTARGRTYSGFCGSQQYYFPNGYGSELVIGGPVASGEDTLISIQFPMPPIGYGVVPGTYYTNVNGGYFNFYKREFANVPGHQIFLADPDKPDKVVTIVVSGSVLGKNGLTMTLGTFSGTARDSTEADVTISNGAFRVGGIPYPLGAGE